MKNIIIILVCLSVWTLSCSAKEYPISRQTCGEILSLANEWGAFGDDLLKSGVEREDSLTLNYISTEAISSLTALQTILNMEFLHAEKKQFHSGAIANIKYYIEGIDGGLKIDLGYCYHKLEKTDDAALIDYLNRCKKLIIKEREFLEKIKEELP